MKPYGQTKKRGHADKVIKSRERLTPGGIIAREIREIGNKWTDEERRELDREAMEFFYGKKP